MKILLLSGSLAEKSHTFSLLKYIEELLISKKVEVIFWDLRAKKLPFAMPQYHKNPIETPDETVKKFVRTVASVDGLVLGTPLYHGSYSGVLKNALDCLAKDAFRNKWVGLVSNCGTRGTNALEHLRSVVRTIYGYSLQTQIATEMDDYKETANNYILKNTEIKERCTRFVDELVHLRHI